MTDILCLNAASSSLKYHAVLLLVPLVAWRDKHMTDGAVGAGIAARYRRWVDVFDEAGASVSRLSDERKAS